MLDARQLDWRLTGHDIDAEIAEAALQARAGQNQEGFFDFGTTSCVGPPNGSPKSRRDGRGRSGPGSAVRRDASRLPATDFVAIVEDNKGHDRG